MDRITALTILALGVPQRGRFVLRAFGAFVVAAGMSGTAQSQINESCEWRGTAPLCGRNYCEPDELTRATSSDGSNVREYSGFGETCLTGWKAYCCKPFFQEDTGVETPPPPPSPPVGVETRRGGDNVTKPGPLQGSKLKKGPITNPTTTEPPPAVPVSFEGAWSAKADNVNYNILMGQTGNTVIGNFVGADGSRGTFSGSLSGRVLRFTWSQMDGAKGSGKFTLSGDGQSFAGSYNFGQEPDDVAGTWNGTRR